MAGARQRASVAASEVDIGFFGAVTVGPIIGGLVAYGHAWRWFYGGLGILVLGFTALGGAIVAGQADVQHAAARRHLVAMAAGGVFVTLMLLAAQFGRASPAAVDRLHVLAAAAGRADKDRLALGSPLLGEALRDETE